MNDDEISDKIVQIAELAVELGWSIGVPTESEKVNGIFIGSTEFLIDLQDRLNTELDILVKDDGGEDPTFH